MGLFSKFHCYCRCCCCCCCCYCSYYCTIAVFVVVSFSSPEATLLLVSTEESRPLARSNIGSSRLTGFPSLCACSESSLTILIGSGLNLLCLHKAIQKPDVVEPGQRSRFLVLTKRSAASGDESVVFVVVVVGGGLGVSLCSLHGYYQPYIRNFFFISGWFSTEQFIWQTRHAVYSATQTRNLNTCQILAEWSFARRMHCYITLLFISIFGEKTARYTVTTGWVPT